MSQHKRIFVFGDTGGHYENLHAALHEIGLNENTYKLPSDVLIYHVGDLVHRGPDSMKVLDMVDVIMYKNPGQWTQLAGNHEFTYLPHGKTFMKDDLPPEGEEILLRWFREGRLKIAASLPAGVTPTNFFKPSKQPTEALPWLITHGGITYGFWKRFLKGDTNVDTIVERLNSNSSQMLKNVNRPGMRLIGGGNPEYAGPIWAHSYHETYRSWNSHGRPFHQLHGHTQFFNFSQKAYYGGRIQKEDHKHVRVQEQLRMSGFLDDRKVAQICVDPDYGVTEAPDFQPSLQFLL